jgi:hypothetical protein
MTIALSFLKSSAAPKNRQENIGRKRDDHGRSSNVLLKIDGFGKDAAYS